MFPAWSINFMMTRAEAIEMFQLPNPGENVVFNRLRQRHIMRRENKFHIKFNQDAIPAGKIQRNQSGAVFPLLRRPWSSPSAASSAMEAAIPAKKYHALKISCRNGNRSIFPNRSAFICRITLARFVRRISGSVYSGRAS